MVDHKRLDALTELVERSGAKLIAVGDGKQLPSIGPGGMFDRLTQHAPPQSWRRPPHQRPRRAAEHGKRSEPANQSARWRTTTPADDSTSQTPATKQPRAPSKPGQSSPRHHDIRKVALIADASNKEIDRLNARAQHLRAERGELGAHETPAVQRHTTGYAKAITSRSPPSTGSPGRRASRTAPAAKSPRSATQTVTRRARRLRPHTSDSPARTWSHCGSPTHNTSTASRARPSIAPSCSPAAGRPARRPPTSKPPAPATAPTGTSPATNSAEKAKTPNASHDSPNA